VGGGTSVGDSVAGGKEVDDCDCTGMAAQDIETTNIITKTMVRIGLLTLNKKFFTLIPPENIYLLSNRGMIFGPNQIVLVNPYQLTVISPKTDHSSLKLPFYIA
jgi:hypothetical protein